MFAFHPLAPHTGICYSLISSTHIAAFKAATAKEKKEGLDDKRRTPHNLASLLLTNTTLRKVQQGSTENGLGVPVL
ncbi:hypothetical protein [Massilia varians]|uniref:hypothetical protein n=1 Tax=Massilia varians TaxID=457921 RepID=UPI00248FF476|nr:hypothetical protein [Massilia varians]